MLLLLYDQLFHTERNLQTTDLMPDEIWYGVKKTQVITL